MTGPSAATIRRRSAPTPSMAATVASSTPAKAPRQPAWAAPTIRNGVGQQHRAAIGRRHADRERRNFGDDGIGPRTLIARPWMLGDDHGWRMNLIGGEQVARLDAERHRHACAVLGHIVGRIVGADAAVKRGIDAVRHAAAAGKETVADAGEFTER